MRAVRFAVIAAIAAASVPLVAVRAADDDSRVASHVLNSIALVAVANGKNAISIGTAWCFWSTPRKSYFLTNQHVVEGATGPPVLKLSARRGRASYSRLIKGRLFPKPQPASLYSNIDLAVIVVDVGHIKPMSLQAAREPEAGTEIGVAGYPSFGFTVAALEGSDVYPSVHFGHVNSIPNSGHYIEFDATTDHGNSGGPVFNAGTGVVVGVVRLGVQSQTSAAVQNNLAINGQQVQTYLQGDWLPYLAYDRRTGVRAHVPCSEDAAAGLAGWKQQACALADAYSR